MNRVGNIVLQVILNIFLTGLLTAQFSTSYNYTPTQLVETVLLGGNSNVTVSNVSFTGDISQIARFSNANSNLNFSDGILLCTGRAEGVSTVVSSNTTVNGFFTGGTFNMLAGQQPGDADLDSLLPFNNPPVYTVDAAVLEFDFVASSNRITFNYVFGSEEHPFNSCHNYLDLMALFLDGPRPSGGSYMRENIAIVPSTNPPMYVGLNTINNYVPAPNFPIPIYCQPPLGTTANTAYYVDNIGGNYIEFLST